MKKQKIRNTILQTLFISILAVIFFLPLYISVVNGFKFSSLIMKAPLAIPVPPTMRNILAVINAPSTDVWGMYKNTIVLMVFSTILTVLVSAPAAYYLARTKTKFSSTTSTYFLIGLMVPYVIVYIPLATMLRVLNVPFGIPVLILVFISGNISFAVFMYTNFIKTLPVELEESAAIDGASKLTTFWTILFPLLKPCTATVCIFTGLGVWNDFMTPLLLGQVQTITVGIYTAIGPHSADWGIVFAYVLFAAVPVIIIYLLMQKEFIAGLTAGATKG